MDGEGRISPKETSEEYVSELYLTYGPKLVRMAHSMLHDFHRAEDAVQIVFTSAFRNRINWQIWKVRRCWDIYVQR